MKIVKVLESKPVYNGVSKKTGKPYSIYSTKCTVEVNGEQFAATVKAFDDGLIKDGADFPTATSETKSFTGRDGTAKTYQEFTVKGDRPSGGGGKWTPKPKIAFADFDRLVCTCANITDSLIGTDRGDKWARVFVGVLGNANVAVDVTTLPGAFKERLEAAVEGKAAPVSEGPDVDTIPF